MEKYRKPTTFYSHNGTFIRNNPSHMGQSGSQTWPCVCRQCPKSLNIMKLHTFLRSRASKLKESRTVQFHVKSFSSSCLTVPRERPSRVRRRLSDSNEASEASDLSFRVRRSIERVRVRDSGWQVDPEARCLPLDSDDSLSSSRPGITARVHCDGASATVSPWHGHAQSRGTVVTGCQWAATAAYLV